MNEISRRDLLRSLLGALGVAGSIVLARAVVAGESDTAPASGDVAERADRAAKDLPGDEGGEPVAFLNRAFRNGGGGGGFRNGGFVNGGGGGFRNGGFVNGGFRNGGFANGAFRNGSFRNY